VRGDLLLVRMDRQSAPQDLTLADWLQFANGQQTAGEGEGQTGEETAENAQGGDEQQKKKRRTD
jgi:hypothetical protein